MHDILVHVRDFEQHTPAARFGMQLAASRGASVTGVYTYLQPGYVAPAFEPELMMDVVEVTRELARDASQARQPFMDWAASLGVRQCSWLVAKGSTGDALAQAATRHDLLVLDHADDQLGLAWDIPEIILNTGAPCIVVPHGGAEYKPFERIAIGWNGSPEAMRAVHAALPFLQGKQALLLCGEERGPYHGVEWDPPFHMMDYLRNHDVAAERCEVTGAGDGAGAALLEQAAAFGAELLVMGAYGRSRFSEWMLGGATRHALTAADIPVLLRH